MKLYTLKVTVKVVSVANAPHHRELTEELSSTIVDLHGTECSAFIHGRFSPNMHQRRGSMRPRFGLDDVE
jgi:hypothetical protein